MPQASFMEDPELKEEGKKWIRHYGCAGCHEISGFEDEGRIGTELTYEGSKPIERLDFALFTEISQRGGKKSEPITDPEDLARLPEGPAKEPWYDHKGFFEHKLASRMFTTRARSSRRRKCSACRISISPSWRFRTSLLSCWAARRVPCPRAISTNPATPAATFRKAGGWSRSTTAWAAISSRRSRARS